MTTTRGIVQIHSAPSALRPHVEWAVGGALGAPVELQWDAQPVEPGSYRCEYAWTGPAGSAARITSAMMRWARLRFEVTEDASAAAEACRYSYTPNLGVFHAATSPSGDIVVDENRLRAALLNPDGPQLRTSLEALLGSAWDAELEPFRLAGDGAPVRWLHRVG
ncbi:DUF3145 domain-containing protein [Nigerium massiliense]|uniref:DUF3145 domain-containing protein n=1 Tax=Nigerium massiliense TaxID=1522317 RepID=UPI00058B832A|nr:DUF3145 domain-containing protein [Nigerium massiliense]